MTLLSRLTAFLGAAALALGLVTAVPRPAAASDEAGYLFGGLLLGGLIGAAIANDSDRDRDRRHVARGHDYRGDHERRVYLPAECRVYSGHRAGYSARCLHHHDYSHAALPSVCAVRVGGHHGTIYRDGCLNRYGYY